MILKLAKHPNSPYNRVHHAFAMGYGYGLVSALVFYINPLSESSSPGVIQCNSCPGAEVYFIGAILSCLFIFLHISWSIILFNGLLGHQWWVSIWVVLSHIGASMGVNRFQNYIY